MPSSCEGCPSGSYYNATLAECYCMIDYYMHGTECKPCPLPGTICDSASTLSMLYLEDGYWRPNNASANVRPCPDQARGANSGCGGGWTSCKAESGLSGVYCRTCAAGSYFDYTSSKCRDCGPLLTTWAIAGPSVVAGLVLVCLIARDLYRHRRSRPKLWALCLRAAGCLKRLVRHHPLTTKLKVAWGFYQIVGRMDAVYHLNLPAAVQHLLVEVSMSISLGLDGVGVLLHCHGASVSAVNELIFWLVAPIVLMAGACASSAVLFVVRRQGGPSWWQQALLHSLRPTLVVAFVCYPIVAQLAFQAFACETLGDDSLRYLPPDYALECGPKGEPTAEYRRLRAVAGLAIAMYPIGISLATALLLYLARKPLRAGRATDFTRAIAFLHDGYEPRFFWWELVEQQRKLLLVGFAVFVQPGSVGQLVFGLVFALLHFLAHVECRPYLRTADDSLASGFLFTLILFFCCLLVYKMRVLAKAVDRELSPYFQMIYSPIIDDLVLTGAMIAALFGGVVISLLAYSYVLVEERRKPRLRWERIGEPVVPPALAEGRYHTFLSHNWRTGQDQARTIKSALTQLVDGLSVWLDVDDMRSKAGTGATNTANFGAVIDTADSMIAIMTGSATDDGEERSDYFRSPPCLQELGRAQETGTPIVWLHETDPLHGGISMQTHVHDCPCKLRPSLEAAIAEGRVVEWHRIRSFQDVSLRLLLAGVLCRTITAANDAVYHPGEAARKRLKLQPPRGGHAFHAYVSAHNDGADELLQTLAAHHAGKRSQTRGACRPRADDGALLWSADAAQCWACMHFVVYLNARTHAAGPRADALHQELDAALTAGKHIVLVHETRRSADGMPFAAIIDATPSWLAWMPREHHAKAAKKRLYQELAVPVCGGEHFAVSTHLLLTAMGQGVSQRARPDLPRREGGLCSVTVDGSTSTASPGAALPILELATPSKLRSTPSSGRRAECSAPKSVAAKERPGRRGKAAVSERRQSVQFVQTLSGFAKASSRVDVGAGAEEESRTTRAPRSSSS